MALATTASAHFVLEDRGPFDIVGDVHGCFDELLELLACLGYVPSAGTDLQPGAHPQGRRLIFLGDLVDGGPNSAKCLELVMALVDIGVAECLLGNHEYKLIRKLAGRNVKVNDMLARTLSEIDQRPATFAEAVRGFFEQRTPHRMLDEGRLVVSHAALPPEHHGQSSQKAVRLALFGLTTGRTDENGLPEMVQWMDDYQDERYLVYGHHVVERAEWSGRSICIDTGCAYGGRLTALRYPEQELVSVPSRKGWTSG